jgi:hypothetical protein
MKSLALRKYRSCLIQYSLKNLFFKNVPTRQLIASERVLEPIPFRSEKNLKLSILSGTPIYFSSQLGYGLVPSRLPE